MNAVYTVAGDLVPVEQGIVDAANPQFPSAIAPDIRDDDVKFKVQKGNFHGDHVPLLDANPTSFPSSHFHPDFMNQAVGANPVTTFLLL